jgi:hypothetical protein
MGFVVLAAVVSLSAAPAPSAFVTVPPLRSVPADGLGSILADVESRMPPGHVYANPGNPTNWAHETTHGLNSRIRTSTGRPRVNAFYVLDGRAVIFTEPRLSLARVVSLVPAEFRRDVLAGGWDDCPLYALDEWTAYTAGTLCGLDRELHGLRPGPADEVHAYGLECAIALSAYAAAVVEAVDRFDPNYTERDELAAFVTWHTARVRETAELARTKSKHFWRPETAAILAAFDRHYPRSEEATP